MGSPGLLEEMRFRHEWRKYQRLILDRFEHRDPSKRTFHVVAPPGAGKTLVGLEIINRLDSHAVTFSPTTTIQQQWRDKVRLFLDEGASPALLQRARAGPERLDEITSLTYQSLSTQAEEDEFLHALGHEALVEELISEQVSEEGAARQISLLRERSPEAYEERVRARARARKRELLASGEVSVETLLHPNALSLLERLVSHGVGCIVLDEAHHLLDYWALILRELISRLPDALVVGLTATPPHSAAPQSMRNYLGLVDGIDFEVPTPAVVRSGHLAPFQDLVRIVEPAPAERELLSSRQRLVEGSFEGAFSDPRFLPHLARRINRTDSELRWAQLLSDEFDLAVAGVRYLLHRGEPLRDDIEVLHELRRAPTQHDREELLREWCEQVLRPSEDPADRERLAEIKHALRALGLVLTANGWRRQASPVDRVLAYSESKFAAMVEILTAEAEAMGERLRAVVITDYERSSPTAARPLRGVLDPAAGGAAGAVRAAIGSAPVRQLRPVMVTGRTVIAAEEAAPHLLSSLEREFRDAGHRIELRREPAGEGAVRILGDGPNWRPRHYVACLTRLLEAGETRCLIGTRGLLGEGWDAVSLNTLIDLTVAGTYATVNQVRGRSIRLDPAWPRKVANNWDLVCLATEWEGGRSDLRRMLAKHEHVWGLGPKGRIITGAGHVDERLLFLADPSPLRTAAHLVSSPGRINSRSLRRARRREDAYRAWGVGEPYENFEFSAAVLEAPDFRMKTAFTFGGSLKRILNLIAFSLVYYGLLTWQIAQGALSSSLPGWLLVLALVLAVVLPIALTAPLIRRYVRTAFLELPVDSYLADFGKAVAEALRATGIAPASPEQVRVVDAADGTYDVHLDAHDERTAGVFAEAFEELFDPPLDQRYLISREQTSLSGSFYGPIFYLGRRALAPFRRRHRALHPVPTIFGRNRERAEAFAAAWKRWVGGGELIYTRSTEGAGTLLEARIDAEPEVDSRTVPEWR